MLFKKILPALIIIFGFLFLANGKAWASELYLSPSSFTIPDGSIAAVQVRLKTLGETVNAVTVSVAFPADKLQVDHIYYGSSKFEIKAEEDVESNLVKISRGTLSPVNGDVNVATIYFKGKVIGNATVYFTGASLVADAINSTNSLNLSKSFGATVQIVAPLPIASPTPNGFMITNIAVDGIATNSATIRWTTNLPADSYVDYGLDTGMYFLNASDPNLVTEHSITLADNLMVPGAVYHFRVISRNKSGNQATSDDQTFQLKGYDIRLHITDLNNNPISDAEVFVYSTQSSNRPHTDTNGDVSFTNMIPGKYLVVVDKNGVQKTGEINILEEQPLQTFNLKLDFPSGFSLSRLGNIPVIIGIVIAAVIILLLIIRLLMRGKGGSGPGGVNAGASIFSSLEQENKPDVYKERNQHPSTNKVDDI